MYPETFLFYFYIRETSDPFLLFFVKFCQNSSVCEKKSLEEENKRNEGVEYEE